MDAVIMDQRHSECSERRANAVLEPHFGGLRPGCAPSPLVQEPPFPRLTVYAPKASPTASLQDCIPATKQKCLSACVAVVMASLETLTLSFWC